MKVKIINCSSSRFWYTNMIGQEFDVIDDDHVDGGLSFRVISSGELQWIIKSDVEIIPIDSRGYYENLHIKNLLKRIGYE